MSLPDLPVFLGTQPTREDLLVLETYALALRDRAAQLLQVIKRMAPAAPEFNEKAKIRAIQVAAANFYGKPVEVMKSKLRTNEVAWVRQLAMVFCREFTEATFEQIGREFGGRDHGTVCYAVAAVGNRCATHPPTSAAVEALRNRMRELFANKEVVG